MERRWKVVWSKLWCFGVHKHGKQIVPTSQIDDSGSGSRELVATGPGQTGGPSLAPPSSPASIVNSSIHSPVSFTLPLSASENACSPGPAKLMFTIGPYAHETQLVSPPVFSTFSTEPSTASLTPPPELAHLTTPSSPDVPFAQLLASSIERKAKERSTTRSPSPLSLASPGEIASGDPKAYQGSLSSRLVSPPSVYSDSGGSSPFSDMDLNVQFNLSMQGALFIRSNTFAQGEIYEQRGGNPTLFKHGKQRGLFCSGDLNTTNVMCKSPHKVWHAWTYEHEAVEPHNLGVIKVGVLEDSREEQAAPFVLFPNGQKENQVVDQGFEDDAIPGSQSLCSTSHPSDQVLPSASVNQSMSSVLIPSVSVTPELMTVHFDTGTQNESKNSAFSIQGGDQHGLTAHHEGFTFIEEAMDGRKYTSVESKPLQHEGEASEFVLPLSPTLQCVPLVAEALKKPFHDHQWTL